MSVLTRHNIKQHCRTCLKKLNMQNINSLPQLRDDEEYISEHKDFGIDIADNGIIKLAIALCVGGGSTLEKTEIVLKEYPECICIPCYKKVHSMILFRQQVKICTEKLQELLCQGAAKFEICDIEESDDIKKGTGSQKSANVFNLLLKDTLMETESVMVNAINGTDIANIDKPVPDPVSIAKSSNIQKSEEVDDDTNMSEEINIQGCKNFNPKFSENDLFRKPSKNSRRKIETESKTQLHDLSTDKRDVRCGSKIRRELAVTKINSETVDNNQKTLALDHSEKKTKRRNKGTKNNFKCEQCSHSFAHKITLDAHIRKVHEGIKRPFQCDRCDKSYSFFGGLYTHIKEIHDAEVRSYACNIPGCDRIYTSFIAMEKHKRLKHTDTPCLKKYICEHCGATFNQSGNLKYHRRTKHPTEAEQAEKSHLKERFECDICKKHFHSRYTLKYHTLQLHSNEMKYECNICGRRMAKKFMLVQHMLVHSTDKMPCDHCGRQFIRKFELEAHIKAVHMKLKPFECQYCLECFASRKTLRHHEYIHTGEKPYVCDVCGQAYRQQTCLKNHRKSHENVHSDDKHPSDANQTLYNSLLAPPKQCSNNSNGNIDKS